MQCKRVARSVLVDELYAVADGFDMGFSIVQTFLETLGRKLKLCVFMDSRTLLDSFITFYTVTEKQLLINIACLRQSYRDGELENLGRIRNGENTADALTKDKVVNALHRILRAHKEGVNVQQWIGHGRIRTKSIPDRSQD